VRYDGLDWPTAQHAFQAAKINRRSPQDERERIRNQIQKATSLRDVRNIGKTLDMDDAFLDRGHALEVMFSIILSKFLQNTHLALRLLHDTGAKPIWHIDADGFWGTNRTLPDPATEAGNGGGGRTRSAGRGNTEPRAWHVGDNWNGKILCVVRILLREKSTMNPQVR
jgi:predicted NAD-dependent protein-ADP-ribosyltransferase YbiA (DUF1768 family)